MILKKNKQLVITMYRYLRRSKFSASAVMRIWILVRISRFTRWSIEGGTFLQASVLHSLRTCNVWGGVEFTYYFMYFHRKNFSGVRSGKHGGQSLKLPWTIIWFPNSINWISIRIFERYQKVLISYFVCGIL